MTAFPMDETGDRGALRLAPFHTAEILGDGIERVGGQLGKHAAQAILDVVDIVEE